MLRKEILDKILLEVQCLNPDVKSISCDDELFGTENIGGLSSLEIAKLMIRIEDIFNIRLDLNINSMRGIIDCIEAGIG